MRAQTNATVPPNLSMHSAKPPELTWAAEPTTGSHQLPGQETKLEILETDTSGQNLLEHDNDDISVQLV